MGLGGRTTALGVKIGVNHRHPASYFVEVSVSCLATRRGRLIWVENDRDAINLSRAGLKKIINLPLTDKNVLSLRAGDIVSLKRRYCHRRGTWCINIL